MPTTPSKLNISFGRNSYSVFGSRGTGGNTEQQQEQKTELLEGTRGNGLHRLKNGVDYVNPGEEDQMEIYGYKRNAIQTATTWCLIIITGGLLRLIFHWVPHLMLQATHSKCLLEEADTVLLVEKFQGKHTSYYVKKLKTLTAQEVSKASSDGDCLIDNEPWSENDSIITVSEGKEFPMLSVHLSGGHFKSVPSIITFSCKKVIYVWDKERCEFVKLRGLDSGILTSTLHQMTGLSSLEQYMRRSIYGNNEMVISVKTILTLLCLEVLNPFYVFQIFSFTLWIADNYVYYAMVILTMSGFSVGMAVLQTRRNQQNLRTTVASSDVATVLRDRSLGQTSEVPAERLVPGDILVIPPHGCLMPCDAVLLTGNCILNESMLTGESVPVTKTPIPSSKEIMYDTKEHARHTLYSGTKVIQTRYFGTEKVLAVVIRTGFNTSKGGLVRSILYPPPVDFKFEQDSYKFVIMLACIAGIGVIFTIVTKVLRGVPSSHIVLEALDLITIVVPPALPAAMTVGRLVAQNRLVKNRIYCTSPRTINVSGSLDCVCFDKTGTLTEDGLDMWGVVPISSRKFQVPVKDFTLLPLNDVLIGMVTCHGITIIDGQLVGDPLDLKMFESTGWTLEEPNVSDTSKFSMLFPTVVRPPAGYKILDQSISEMTTSPMRQNSTNSEIENISLNNMDNVLTESTADLADQGLEIGIVRQFPFTSSLQRMSVITRTLGANHYDLYCKGSPEMILSLSKPDSIPPDFNSVLQEYTSEGYRVIALAHKSLNRLTYAKVQRIVREKVEIDLTFLGFVILENRLKPETMPVISALNAASIKIVMVTGDNMLTALSVARDCDIVKPGMPVIAVATISHQNQTKPQVYFTRSDSQHSPMSPNGQGDFSEMTDLNSVISLETIESGSFTNHQTGNNLNYLSDNVYHSKNKYVFSLTGKTWAMIKQHYPELIPKLVTRGAIFARMSPDQKQQLVQELQALGYYVAMVGDGANDCGALKAAHTGISLSDTESSVASPFTSRETNISCVLTVIREGRAALVTSFGIFKYMAAYSLIQFVSVMLLYGIESNLTDIEFLYIDLLIISIFAFFFGRTEAYAGPLVKTPPLNSLFSITPVISLFIQILLVSFFQYISLWHLRQMEWFTPFIVAEDKDDVGCQENYTIFIISSFQYIMLAVVFSKGPPYRKSLFTNYGLLSAFILLTIFSTYLAIYPIEWLQNQFELVLPHDMNFRFYLVAYGIGNFFLSILVEYLLVEYLFFGKLRHLWFNMDKTKRKYIAIERDMIRDLKWPPLSQEPLPESVPDILIRQSVTEIKIEKRLPEPYIQLDVGFLNNPENATFKRFGSAREVTLNPRSLFNDKRNTVSLHTVPCFEDKDLTIKHQQLELEVKRRHNSESENGINQYENLSRIHNTNPIATLPRNSVANHQQQKFRQFNDVLIHKSEDSNLRPQTQSVLELDILPS